MNNQICVKVLPDDKVTFFYLVFLTVFAIMMSILENHINGNVFRIICFVPIILSLIHFIIFRYKGYILLNILCFSMPYLISILIAFYGIPKQSAVIHIMTISLACVFIILLMSINYFVNIHVSNFTKKSYTESVEALIGRLKEDYILSDWKSIDYDRIYDEVMPIADKAEMMEDEALYCIALLNCQYYMNDGHVMLEANNSRGERAMNRARDILAGNDYGFSLVRLEDNQVIAVLVEEDSQAYRNGIRNGTVITKWNQKEICGEIDKVRCIYPNLHNFPVAENEQYIKAFFLAGQGEKQVNITYMCDGMEKNIELEAIGSYRERLEEALDLFYHRGQYAEDGENFAVSMAAPKCGYLRIYEENIRGVAGIFSKVTNNYDKLTEKIDRKLSEIGDIESLIIDLRNNSGGFDQVGLSLATLFAEGSWFAYADGELVNGKFVPVDSYYFNGTGKWKHLKISVLVNSECRSAGDTMTYFLSKLPNVTIYGITGNNCIDQNPGGFCICSDGLFTFRYPIGPVLNENNQPMLETRADRSSTIELDHRIPLDENSALSIFEEKEDYELQYVISQQ